MKAKKKAQKHSWPKNLVRAGSILLILAFVAAPSVLHSKFGYGISPILSGSMRPYAQPGDAFLTVNRLASTLKVGEIATMHAPGTDIPFAHRIVSITHQGDLIVVQTKGDANPVPESAPYLVPAATEIAVVVGVVPYVGRPLVYLSSIQGRQAGLSLIVIANVLTLFLSLFKKKVKTFASKAERIYKDLFNESHEVAIMSEKKVQIYKELYREMQAKAAEDDSRSQLPNNQKEELNV